MKLHQTAQARYLGVLHLAIGLVILIVSVPVLQSQKSGSDFEQDYAAAIGWWSGRDVSLPLRELFSDEYPDLAMKWDPISRTAHPPFATLLALPFGLLQWESARILWFALSWIAMILGWHVMKSPPILCATMGILWMYALQVGTHEPILFLLLSLAHQSRSKNSIVPSLLVGCATAIKVYPGIFALGLFVGYWRNDIKQAFISAATVILTVAFLTGFAESVVGLGAFENWVTYMPVNVGLFVDLEINISLVRYLRFVVPFASPSHISLILLILLILPILKQLTGNEPIRPLVPVALLVTPLCWLSYFCLFNLDRLRSSELFLLFLFYVLMIGRVFTGQTHPLVTEYLGSSFRLPLLAMGVLVWLRWAREKTHNDL